MALGNRKLCVFQYIKRMFMMLSTWALFQVIVNLYSLHMDPVVWKDPAVFRPERFLDENGALYGKDRVLPFSIGRL